MPPPPKRELLDDSAFQLQEDLTNVKIQPKNTEFTTLCKKFIDFLVLKNIDSEVTDFYPAKKIEDYLNHQYLAYRNHGDQANGQAQYISLRPAGIYWGSILGQFNDFSSEIELDNLDEDEKTEVKDKIKQIHCKVDVNSDNFRFHCLAAGNFGFVFKAKSSQNHATKLFDNKIKVHQENNLDAAIKMQEEPNPYQVMAVKMLKQCKQGEEIKFKQLNQDTYELDSCSQRMFVELFHEFLIIYIVTERKFELINKLNRIKKGSGRGAKDTRDDQQRIIDHMYEKYPPEFPENMGFSVGQYLKSLTKHSSIPLKEALQLNAASEDKTLEASDKEWQPHEWLSPLYHYPTFNTSFCQGKCVRQYCRDLYELGEETYNIKDPEKGLNPLHSFSWELSLEWFKGLFSGLHFLHENDIIHRDLSARNLMVEFNPATNRYDKMVIIDFGLAQIVRPETDSKNQKISKQKVYLGTLSDGYPFDIIAPEVFDTYLTKYKTQERSAKFSTNSDIWAAGILMWDILNNFCNEKYTRHIMVQIDKNYSLDSYVYKGGKNRDPQQKRQHRADPNAKDCPDKLAVRIEILTKCRDHLKYRQKSLNPVTFSRELYHQNNKKSDIRMISQILVEKVIQPCWSTEEKRPSALDLYKKLEEIHEDMSKDHLSNILDLNVPFPVHVKKFYRNGFLIWCENAIAYFSEFRQGHKKLFNLLLVGLILFVLFFVRLYYVGLEIDQMILKEYTISEIPCNHKSKYFYSQVFL